LFSFIEAGRADAVEQLLGRAHDQHPPIVPQAQADAPPGRRSAFPGAFAGFVGGRPQAQCLP
jgi:hypothetical protein